MPGHALADRGERTAGDLPDEIQDPFAHLAEQGRGDPRVSLDRATTVAAEYTVEGSVFTGQLNWVELKVGGDDHSHLLDPQDHIHVLMGRQ